MRYAMCVEGYVFLLVVDSHPPFCLDPSESNAAPDGPVRLRSSAPAYSDAARVSPHIARVPEISAQRPMDLGSPNREPPGDGYGPRLRQSRLGVGVTVTLRIVLTTTIQSPPEARSIRCTRQTEHLVAVTGDFGRCWRAVLTTSLVLLFLTVAFGCGSQDERLGAGVVGPASRVMRDSPPPPARCDPLVDQVPGNFVRWSRDGSSIVFYRIDGLYQAAADGSAVRRIDTEPTMGWHAFDVAPDGRQLVYSGCRVKEVRDGYGKAYPHLEYELVRTNIGRGWPTFPWWPQEIGVNVYSGYFPSWSTDGTRIAFHSGDSGLIVKSVERSQLHDQETVLIAKRIAGAPQWSPDSQRLAVTVDTGAPRVGRVYRSPVVYTVGADGSDPRRLVSGVVSAPSWSPDGQWLAYARINQGDVILAAIRADGTDERQLATLGEGGWTVGNVWIRTVAWSPDGAHLLYSCGPHLCTVTLDGRPVARTTVLMPRGSVGAWSPDGTRIAVAGLGLGDPALYTMAPDGGQRCSLAKINTQYAPTRNLFERLWRTIFDGENNQPLIAVGDCEAAA